MSTSLLSRSIRSSLRLTQTTKTTLRPLSTTPSLHAAPHMENPPAAKQHGRSSHVSEDAQSSASTASSKSTDDHPAKQPDPQAPAERSTGFQEVHEVKGGKEGLGARSDRDSKGN